MQIVIDIPEDVYTRLFDNGIQDNEIAVDDVCEMARALRLGKPVTKGHGRLIDETDLKTLYGLDDRLWWGNAVKEFTDLPTILEADKGE